MQTVCKFFPSGLWLQTFQAFSQNPKVVYYTAKPVAGAFIAFIEKKLNFHGLTSAISNKVLTNQGSSSISVIL